MPPFFIGLMKEMAATDIKAGRAYVELYVKNRDFLRGLRNARERVKQFANDLRATGQILAGLGGASLLGIGLVSKRFADFDDQMRAVKAVTQATQGEFEKLTKTAKDLGASTSYTAVEVAGLMAELGRAGFLPAQIDKMTGAVLDLARATGTDAVQSAGIMSATIRQFNLEASDAARVADGLTAAANGSFNTVEALGEALSYAGTTAADLGVPLEETLAILGSLGNVGIQGSNAGTALRRLLTLTSAEAEKLEGIFGVAFVDAAGNARPLVDALDEVNKATSNLGTAERSKKFNEAFGLLGITGASAISKNAQSTKDLLAAIRAAGGQASKTAKEMDSGLGGALRKTASVIEGVGLAIGEALAKPLASLLDIFQGVADAAREWIKANQKIVLAVAALGTAATVAGIAMVGMGSAILAINAALAITASLAGAVGAVFAVITSPIGLLTAALSAGAYAWVTYSKSGQAALNSILSIVAPFAKTITDTFSGIADAIMSGNWVLAGKVAMARLKVVFLQGVDTLSGIFGDFAGKFATQLSGGDFYGAWKTIVLQMSEMWAKFAEGMVAMFSNAAKAVSGIWGSTVKGIANSLLEQSAAGGVTGKIASAILGVDLAEEQRRSNELNRQLGLPQNNILNEAKSSVNSGVNSQVSAFNSRVDELRKSFADSADAASSANRSNIGGQSSQNRAAINNAQAELDRLRKEAMMAYQEAAAESERRKKESRDAASNAATNFNGSHGGLGSRIVGTFSAAALQAQGQFNNPSERTAKSIERIEKVLTSQEKINEDMLREMRMGNVFV